MIPILIATAITCSDVSDMVERTRRNKTVTPAEAEEIVQIYEEYLVESLGLECDWDANAD
jgi:hypothetical protein